MKSVFVSNKVRISPPEKQKNMPESIYNTQKYFPFLTDQRHLNPLAPAVHITNMLLSRKHRHYGAKGLSIALMNKLDGHLTYQSCSQGILCI